MDEEASNGEPSLVRLTGDYLNLAAGHGIPAGTILERQPNGQYWRLKAKLGDMGVWGFEGIRDICEPVTH